MARMPAEQLVKMIRAAISTARGTAITDSQIGPAARSVLDAYDTGDIAATKRACVDFLGQTEAWANTNVESAFHKLLCYREDPSSSPSAPALVAHLGEEMTTLIDVALREGRLDAVETLLETDPLSKIRVLVRRLREAPPAESA
jgi:hypothetical protein